MNDLDAGQKLTLNRVPTLTFPPLHLGSFNEFDHSTFPAPPVSAQAQTQGAGVLKSPSLNNTRSLAPGRPTSRGSTTTMNDVRPQPSISEGSNSRTLRPASRESTHSRASTSTRSRQLSGPTSPPPTGALPPLPTSPERSPENANGTFGAAQAAALAHITGAFGSSSLTLNERSSTPTYPDQPVLRDSPIPRRRTLIQQPDARERRVSMVLDDIPLVPSPLAEQFPLPEQRDGYANGDAAEGGTGEAEHKLEKKTSTNNLRASPTSVKKRSLPRPPSDKPALEIVTALPARHPQDVPLQQPSRAAPSASTLPIIAGLADAGPYSFTKPQGPPGLGRPPPAQARQEEVCLECMMRDQDLADIDVSTPGVWGRASDAGLDELKWREESLVGSMAHPRLDPREFGTSDEESSGPSPPSTTNSLEEAEARRKEASRQRKAAMKARKREIDYRVAKEIGWRGFKWEEGTAGEGLPRGFRGTRPGKLTEDGIKAVMTKFPSASALRYNNLQTYLRNQYHLVMDVAAEASRLGYFPAPPEVAYEERQAGPAPLQVTPLRGSSVKPSPSSPADLSAIAGRSKPAPLARPLTHYIPEREPLRVPTDQSLRLRPTLTSLSTSPNNQYISDIDYSPISPADSGVRPFSFAVRAGATGHGMGEEGQTGRRSFFGRWGGSVTSFFGGSQGGSGSMMDMQYVCNLELADNSIGLDNERRNRTSSFNVHSQPRAVSLASPTRPSFFSRDSRDSTQVERSSRDMDRNGRTRGQSLSTSRLSQVLKPEEEPETPSKRKGLKGLIKRMRGKSVSAKTPPAMAYEQFNPAEVNYPRPPQQRQDSGQLAPPPPLSYLVGRGEKHARNRSGSSSSMMTDTSGVPQQYGNRSVSAPIADTSSGDQSGSPTSSKYDRVHDSYNSISRRSNNQTRYSRDEGANGDFTAPQAVSHPPVSHYPLPQNPSFRSGNKTASSMSASSVVETPPPVHMPLSYPQHIPEHAKYPHIAAPSPNRFKSLPPLPPDSGSSGRPSPNPDENGQETIRSLRPARSNTHLPQPLYQPVHYRQDRPANPAFQEQARARASYDTGETRRMNQQMQAQQHQQRMAQSMYMQNPPGEYGYQQEYDGQYRPEQDNGMGTGTATTPRGKEKRKGLKGLFGVSKAGRLA